MPADVYWNKTLLWTTNALTTIDVMCKLRNHLRTASHSHHLDDIQISFLRELEKCYTRVPESELLHQVCVGTSLHIGNLNDRANLFLTAFQHGHVTHKKVMRFSKDEPYKYIGPNNKYVIYLPE